MAGPDLTAADIVAYPGLKLLLRASRRPEAAPLELGLDPFETRFPGIAAGCKGSSSSQVTRRLIRRIGDRHSGRVAAFFIADVGSLILSFVAFIATSRGHPGAANSGSLHAAAHGLRDSAA
jgi:hypothetical protein